jgi:hypothetical protein
VDSIKKGTNVSYYPDVFAVGDECYAIPKTFTTFNDVDHEPVLEQIHGRHVIPQSFLHLGDDYETSCRILALRMHRDDWITPVSAYRETELTLGNKVFLVLTEYEADTKLDKELERLSDDLPLEGLRHYFNEAAWKADCARDGRGRYLSSYDHLEQRQEVVAGTYLIYRQS